MHKITYLLTKRPWLAGGGGAEARQRMAKSRVAEKRGAQSTKWQVNKEAFDRSGHEGASTQSQKTDCAPAAAVLLRWSMQ